MPLTQEEAKPKLKKKLPSVEELVTQRSTSSGQNSPALDPEQLTSEKKKITKEQGLLKDAFTDLEEELKTLRGEKRELEQQLIALAGQLGNTQAREIRLRNEISRLMKKENIIDKKKSELKEKMGAVNKKIEKITVIERELKDV